MTLYRALATIAKLIAPAMPFIADEIYRNLVCSVDPDAVPSVHDFRLGNEYSDC